MPFAVINDINFFHEQQGQGDDLILIGGLLTNHTIWEGMISSLAQHYKVLRFDNRGAGQTEVPNAPYFIADMAKDVVGLMDHLNIKQANIVGHSMGGNILQQLALDHPERIKKAVICSSSAKIPLLSMLHLNTTVKMMQDNLKPELILETAIPWIFGTQYLENNSVENIIAAIMQDPHPQSNLGFYGQLDALREFDTREKLSRIKLDVLITTGKEDLLTTVSCSEFMHQHIKNSSLKILESAGHMPQIECPDKLVALIKEFITY